MSSAVECAETVFLSFFQLTKLLIETVLVLGGEIEELDDDKLRYILVSQSPCEPVSGFSVSLRWSDVCHQDEC